MNRFSTRFFDLFIILILALVFSGCLLFWSVYSPFLFDPTPGMEGHRIVEISRRAATIPDGNTPFNSMDLQVLGEFQEVFEGVAVFKEEQSIYEAEGYPRLVNSARVSPQFFRVFGVGTGAWELVSNSEQARRPVLLSFSCWNSRFNSREVAPGSMILIDGEPHEIVGVLRQSIRWPTYLFRNEPEFFLPWKNPNTFAGRPATFQQAGDLPGDESLAEARSKIAKAGAEPGYPLNLRTASADSAEDGSYRLVGRLHTGESVLEAHQRIVAALRESASAAGLSKDLIFQTRSLDDLVRAQASWFFTLLTSGLILWLGTCLNLSILLLARTLNVLDGWTVRKALGARHWQLAFELFRYFLPRSLGGAALGLLLSSGAAKILTVVGSPAAFPVQESALNIGTLLFAILLGVASTLFCIIGPLVIVSRHKVASLLRDAPSETAPGRRLGKSLVFGQLAVSACLVVMTAAVAQQYLERELLDLGFEHNGVFAVELIDPPSAQGISAGRGLLELQRRLGAIPGIESTAASTFLPMFLGGSATSQIFVPDSPFPHQKVQFRQVRVTQQYFSLLRMTLKGRPPHSIPGRNEVVVSRSFASRFWKDENTAIGRSFVQGPREFRITGVVNDSASDDLSGPALPGVYIPLAESSLRQWPFLLIRSSMGKADLTRQVEAALSLLNRPPVLASLRTMEELHWNVLSRPRFLAFVFVSLSSLLLCITAVSVFASLSRELNSRRREMAIRSALGADTSQLCRQFLVKLVWIAFLAVLAGGVLGYYSLTKTHLFMDVDSIQLGTAAVGLAAVLVLVILSALFPILHGTRQNPSELLRTN